MQLTGLVAATYTPFHPDSGEVNREMIPGMIDFMIDAGVAGLYVCGSTGEGESLSVEERKTVAEVSISAVKGRIPVVVQVGHNSLVASKELSAHAAEIGADAISTLPPTYFKPQSIDDLVGFISEVTKCAPGLPYYYYHIPRMSGVNFDIVELVKKAGLDIPTFRGVKFSDFFLADLMACRQLEGGRFDIVFGSDEMLLGALACGAKGAVGSCYGFAAPLWSQIMEAYSSGDRELTLLWMEKAERLVRLIARSGPFHAVVKQVIWPLLGFDPGPLRSPQPRLSDEQIEVIRGELEASGFAAEIASGDYSL